MITPRMAICLGLRTTVSDRLIPAPAGALLAKGPDPTLGEVHKRSCSSNIHMEEEKVQVKVQEDEVEDGREK